MQSTGHQSLIFTGQLPRHQMSLGKASDWSTRIIPITNSLQFAKFRGLYQGVRNSQLVTSSGLGPLARSLFILARIPFFCVLFLLTVTNQRQSSSDVLEIS